jgi:cytochrome b
MQNEGKTIRVWDLVVRAGHWSLVIGFFVAYIAEDDFMTIHVWAGYVVAVVVLIRLVWGFIGSKHARFSDFIYSPGAVLGYLRELITNSGKHYMGHNPAAGAMVIALLIGLIGTVASGMVLYAVEENKGPLSGLVTASTAPVLAFPRVINGAYADDDDDDRDDHETGEHRREHHGEKQGEHNEDEFWEEVHEIFANLTLLLVVFHVAGVLFSSYVHDENLIKSMISGNKRGNHSESR